MPKWALALVCAVTGFVYIALAILDDPASPAPKEIQNREQTPGPLAPALTTMTSDTMDRPPTASGRELAPPPPDAAVARNETGREVNTALIDALVEEGFTPVEAELILDLEDRYRPMEYGRHPAMGNLLRQKLGDERYAKYLRSRGEPEHVAAATLPSALHESLRGIAAGDQIARIGGRRVFSVEDVESVLTAVEGNPVVEVIRDDRVVHFPLRERRD